MFIFHISDVHIDIDRVENLMNSFNILISRILEKGPQNSILLILGDIFENKTLLTTDDISIFDYMMRELNKNAIYTIIIIGNHDFNINTTTLPNAVQFNHISIEILTKPYSNVKCLTYTQVYTVTLFPSHPIEFHIYSIVDNKIPTYTKNSNIKIALLHDGVNGAKYDNGQIIESMRFGIADFAKYNYTMLGDIHKPQFLTDTIAYCGSFVQKNRGEGVDHGYILWDLLQHSASFHFIPMKNVTIKITAYENQSTILPDVSGSHITYVQLWHKKCSSEYITKLVDQIKTKYKIIHRVVNRDAYNHTKEPTPELNNFKEIDHSSCIRDLLKKHPEETIVKIIDYHKSKIQNMRDINHVNYNINYLSWSNILCYGENNYINFSDLNKSIVVLNGKNKYGKSSIIDILIRILFNECERGYKKDIVNKNKSTGHIKISISVGADEYIAEQVMYKVTTSTHHRLYKNGNNITKSTIIETYKYLGEVVGIGSYSDFVNMTTALQNRKFLVDMKEEETLMLLIKLLNIEILEHINKQIKSRQKILTHDINKHNEELTRIDIDIKSILERGGYFRGATPSKPEDITGASPNTTDGIVAHIAERLVKINEIIVAMRSGVEKANGQMSLLNKEYDSGVESLSAEILESNISSLKLSIGDRVADIGSLSSKTILLQNLEKDKVLLCAEVAQNLATLNKLTGGRITDILPVSTNITKEQYSRLTDIAELLKLNIYKPPDYIAAGNRVNVDAAVKLIEARSTTSMESMRADIKKLYSDRKPIDTGDYAGKLKAAQLELKTADDGLCSVLSELKISGNRVNVDAAVKLIEARSNTSMESMRADIKKLYSDRKPIDTGDYTGKLKAAQRELKTADDGLCSVLSELKIAGINPDAQSCSIIKSTNITELMYKKYKDYISSPIASKNFAEFADPSYIENIKNKIANLKNLVFAKKTIISTTYIKNEGVDFLGFILPKKAEYYDIMAKTLPDYGAVSDECAAITARIKKYNDNYGDMRFYDKCDCCAHNKSIISTIDISVDNDRMDYLSGIIAAKDTTIKARDSATKYIKLIERYESDIKVNADIIKNNKLFDELVGLSESYDLYNDISSKKSQVEIYENIVSENIKTSLIIKYKPLTDKQDELKILCADLSKKIHDRETDTLHNTNINAKLIKLEAELIEVEKAISLIIKYKPLTDKQDELKILCADLSKKIHDRETDTLHNTNINAKLIKLEAELIEVEKATRYLSIIKLSEKYDADYEQLILTQNKILEYDTAKYSTKILIGKSGIETINININTLLAEIDIINKYKEYEDLKLKYKLVINNKKILDEIEILKIDLFNKTEALTEHIEQQQSLMVWQATLSAKTQRLDELKKVISVDENELTFITIYQKCVDKKKGISQRILTDLCERFNLECNKILHQISDFELEITVDSAQILRIYTIDGGVKIPAAMASGYQKFVIDMIMRIVLTTILSGSYSNNMSNPNMLIIDEGFGCLDNKNFIEVANVLKQLKDNFKCIIVITHINELKAYADETIDIMRVNNYSRIKYHNGNITEEPDILDEKQPENPMLNMKILNEMSVFADELAASRVEKNEEQAVRRAEISKQREAVIKIRTEKAQTREESKANRSVESAKKKEEQSARRAEILAQRDAVINSRVESSKKKEERNLSKLHAKAEKEAKAAELERIITTPELLQPYIIEINETTCKCKACAKTFLHTEKKILDHITSSTYIAKHRKYVKSML